MGYKLQQIISQRKQNWKWRRQNVGKYGLPEYKAAVEKAITERDAEANERKRLELNPPKKKRTRRARA